MDRRGFLVRTGLSLVASALATWSDTPVPRAQIVDWDAVRGMFSVSTAYLHFGGLYLASHPTPVQQAIETHRRGLDDNPVDYLHEQGPVLEAGVLRAAASYLGGSPTDIALTDSTTMGLGLLYTGLSVGPGQEILTTAHDFYATHEALQLSALRSGASMRRIALYQRLETATQDEIVESVAQALGDRTRILAVTWVHSSTGLKIPIQQIADVVRAVNAQREPAERVLLCVDGVHGFGVEDLSVAELGVDFFVSGCHKWLCGPRGTGLVWGRGDAAWAAVRPTIPTFGNGETPGSLNTPGGFHSFEHRWALSEAFNLHQQLGRARIAERVHGLNTHLKTELATMPNVRLVTPLAEELSSGLVCFDIVGLTPAAVVERLHERKVIATTTPYATPHARLAAGLLNSDEQVDAVLSEVHALQR